MLNPDKFILIIIILNLNFSKLISTPIEIFENARTLQNGFIPTFISKSYEVFLNSNNPFPTENLAVVTFSKDFNATNIFERFYYEGDNIVLIVYPSVMDHFNKLVQSIFTLEKSISHKNALIRRLKYFIMHPNSSSLLNLNHTERLKILKEFGTPGNLESDIYFVVNHEDKTSLFEIYSLNSNSMEKLIVNYVKIKDYEKKWNRRMDLRNFLITAAASPLGLETIISYNEIGEPLLSTAGLGTDIFHYFRDALHFKTKIVEETKWPKLLPNGTWDGLGKLVLANTVDIALNSITHSISRSKPFRFLFPYMRNPLTAFFVQPPPSSLRNVFTHPFTLEFWIALGIFEIVSLLAFIFILYIQKRLDSTWNKNSAVWKDLRDILSDYGLWNLSSLCQQGFEIPDVKKAFLSGFAVKALCFSILLTGVITYGAYTAAIFSSLSATVIPIKTLNDLLRSQIEIIADNTSETAITMLKYASNYGWEDPTAPSLLKYKVKGFKATDDIAKSDFFQKSTAVITYPEVFYQTNINVWKINDKSLCEDINFIPVSVRMSLGMMTKLGCPYRKLFNIKMIEIYQSGLMKRYQSHFYRLIQPRCTKKHLKSAKELGIIDLFTAFIIIICGFFCSGCFVIVEFLFFRISKTK